MLAKDDGPVSGSDAHFEGDKSAAGKEQKISRAG
jgi:hypothetical protein